MVGRSEICLISGIYISEETVGVFCVFVVVNSPIGIVKISTERVLLINVAVYMAGDTCQIVACGRSVNSSQQSVSGRYRLVNRSRDVVSCKTGCEVIRQFRFGAYFHVVSVHASFGDNTVLVRISKRNGV